MADQMSSPGRSASLARAPSSLRSSSTSSFGHRSTASTSPAPRSTNHAVSNTIPFNSMWLSTGSRATTVPTMGPMNKSFREDSSTRQWSFMGLEWMVRDIHKLRDFVEGVKDGEAEDPDFDILKQSPTLGDNKFKLEIAFTPTQGKSPETIPKRTLSLYVISLMVDFAQSEYESSASMMAAIKCQADQSGERGSPPEWVWDLWQTNWLFRQGNEVWECPLPSLSTLLENPRIRETDSFVICVQIHSPSGPTFPHQPSVHSVPRNLLDGLEALLDNANTGDVRFICLERSYGEPPSSTHVRNASTPTSSRSLSPVSLYSTFSTRTTVRKRIIYAHSDILTRRSEYFANMLTSSFSENASATTGDRKIYTIVVEEADFETVYWLLKYCYGNWLLFREDDDPRIAMDGINAGLISEWSKLGGGEWDWKTFPRDDNDARSVASGDSRLSATSKTSRPEVTNPAPTSSPSTPTPSTSKSHATTNTPTLQNSSSRRTSGTSAVPAGSSSGLSRIKAAVPIATHNYAPPPHQRYPLSPRPGRPSGTPTADPHPHPAPSPRPASALSMYRIAHRYAMPGLASLALEHMISTLTPQSCFALLLATSLWDELYLLVEDYVVDKWEEVSVCEEFERCCQEVAAGEWGSDGGKTLTSIFRRLRAP